MQTERLYYEDAYIRTFTARVESCRKGDGSWEVILDRSAFYPEGGGQPADTGILEPDASGSSEASVRVTDVQEKNGELIHYTERALTQGSFVRGRIDWDRRFDLMQQHSGEHIVSGLIHQQYGYDNKGFHMGTDVITIDLNGMLDNDQLRDIEQKANEAVWQNGETQILCPDQEELSALSYRSKKELSGQVRIVNFPGADSCACCGLHVRRTGEIGIIKLLSCVKFRDGVRIEMISGRRVLDHFRKIEDQNHQISVLLSARPDATAEAVRRLQDEMFGLKGRLRQMEEESFAAEAEKWRGHGDVLLLRPQMETDSLRKLTDAVMQTCGGRCAVFSADPDGTWKYAMGEKDGDLRAFTKKMNEALSGRGGGKPFFVQGQVQADEAGIRRFFEG